MPRELQPIIDRLELSLSRLTQAADSLADRLEGVDPSAPGRTAGPSLGAGGVTLGGGGLPVGSSGAVKVEIDESSSGRFLGPAAGSVLGATISPVAPFLALGAIIQSGLGDDIADLGIRFGGSVTRALIQRGDEIGQAIVTGLIRELSTVAPGIINAVDREANVSGVVRGANETLGTFTGFPYPTLQNRIFGRQIFGDAPTSSSAAPGIFQQTGAAALTVANRFFDRGSESVLDALPDNLPANVNQFIDPRAYYRRIRGGVESLFGPQEQPQVIPISTPPGPQGADPLNVTRNFGGPFNPQTYGDPFSASRNFAGAQYDPTAFGVIGEFAAASAVDSAAFAFGGPVGLGLSIGTQTFFGGASVANAELPPAAELIRRHEGFRSQPYYDPAGLPTRGYGELLSSTPGADLSQFSAVSESEANQQLAQRIQELERQIDQLVQVPINQNQRAALTSFAYNVGTNAFADSTLLRELNAGDYEGAANQFPSWVFAGGQRLPGLERRRAEEAELFRTPVQGGSGIFGRISNFITPPAGAQTREEILEALERGQAQFEATGRPTPETPQDVIELLRETNPELAEQLLGGPFGHFYRGEGLIPDLNLRDRGVQRGREVFNQGVQRGRSLFNRVSDFITPPAGAQSREEILEALERGQAQFEATGRPTPETPQDVIELLRETNPQLADQLLEGPFGHFYRGEGLVPDLNLRDRGRGILNEGVQRGRGLFNRVSDFITPEAGAATIPSRFFNPQNFPITHSRNAFLDFAQQLFDDSPDLIDLTAATRYNHGAFLAEQRGGYSEFARLSDSRNVRRAIGNYQTGGVGSLDERDTSELLTLIDFGPDLQSDIRLYRGIEGQLNPADRLTETPLRRSHRRNERITSFSFNPRSAFNFSGGYPGDAVFDDVDSIDHTFLELFVPQRTAQFSIVPDLGRYGEDEVLLNALSDLQILNQFQAGPFEVLSVAPYEDALGFLQRGVPFDARAGLGIGVAGAAASRGLFGGTEEAQALPSRLLNPQNFPITSSREAFEAFARRLTSNDPSLIDAAEAADTTHRRLLAEQRAGNNAFDSIGEYTLNNSINDYQFDPDSITASARHDLRQLIRSAPGLSEDTTLYRGVGGLLLPRYLDSPTPLRNYGNDRGSITSFSFGSQRAFDFTGAGAANAEDALRYNDLEGTFLELFLPRGTAGAALAPDLSGHQEFEVLLNSLSELQILNRFQAGAFDVISAAPNVGATSLLRGGGAFSGPDSAFALAPPPSDPQSALVNQLQALPEAAQNLIPPELQSRIADLVAIGPQPAVNAGARRVARFSPGTLANTFTDIRRTGALLGGVGEAFPQASPLTEPTVEYLEQVQSSLGEAIGELPFGERIREQALIAEDAIEGLAESSDLFGRSVAEALTGAVRQTDGWEDRLRRIPALLQDIIFELTIVRPATNIISDLFSSAFGNITNNVFGGGTQGNSSVAGESGVQITQNISDADPSRAYQYTDAALAAAESNRQRGANRVTSPYYNG